MSIFKAIADTAVKVGTWAFKNPDTVFRTAEMGFQAHDERKARKQALENEYVYNSSVDELSEQLETIKISLNETFDRLDYVTEKTQEDLKFLQSQIDEAKSIIETLHTAQKVLEKRVLISTVFSSVVAILAIIIAIAI